MIKFENVSFSYPNGFKAVDNLNFEIEIGENIAIIGQNGAGKTTTVKMINGLLRPVSGSVLVDDKNTKDHTTAQLSRTAGYVFQNPDDQIFNDTVRKEIEFGPKIIGQNDKEIEANTQWAAGLCGLSNHLEDNPYDLPLSIRKFVTIASVLAMRSKIVILDEPTAGQDLNGLRLLENILKELKKEQVTIITITHDMEFVIENFNKIIVMSQKQILKVGNPHEIFSDDSLLQRSMLKKPFIKNLVDNLEMNSNIFEETEFVASMLEKSKVVSAQ